jgi:hypothetical protein
MDRTRPVRRARRQLLALGVLALALASLSAGRLSLALFTDQESVAAAFSTGTVVLDDVRIAGLTMTTAGMVPGDTVTDDVAVENDGSVQLRYAVSTATSNADAKGLRDVLTLAVRTVDVTTPGVPCDNFDGTVVLSAAALSASGAGFGDPAAGVQAGDRTLAAAASETLCFRVALPVATGNAYQAATATTTFTFDAEQTAGNP